VTGFQTQHALSRVLKNIVTMLKSLVDWTDKFGPFVYGRNIKVLSNRSIRESNGVALIKLLAIDIYDTVT
jgi:hypothetical protein